MGPRDGKQSAYLLRGAFWRTVLVLGMRGGTKIIPVREVSLASLANLAGIKADVLLPGHGEPWTGAVEEAVRQARTAGPSDMAPARPRLRQRRTRNTTGRKTRIGCPHARPPVARKSRVVAASAICTAGHGTPWRCGQALVGAGVSTCGGPARYEIRVAGVARRAAWFGGLQISGEGEETVICGLLADQSALHGLLTKIRDLGLCLTSVRRLGTGQDETRHHDQT